MKIESLKDVQKLVNQREASVRSLTNLDTFGGDGVASVTLNRNVGVAVPQNTEGQAIMAILRVAHETEIRNLDAKLKELGVETV